MTKIRRLVKHNVHVSGTHSTWVLDFLNVAIDKTKGGRMLNWLGVYYFYICAEDYDDAINSVFEPFLCNNMKESAATDILILGSESSLTGDDNWNFRTPPTL